MIATVRRETQAASGADLGLNRKTDDLAAHIRAFAGVGRVVAVAFGAVFPLDPAAEPHEAVESGGVVGRVMVTA